MANTWHWRVFATLAHQDPEETLDPDFSRIA
jgi:hypothetical protein